MFEPCFFITTIKTILSQDRTTKKTYVFRDADFSLDLALAAFGRTALRTIAFWRRDANSFFALTIGDIHHLLLLALLAFFRLRVDSGEGGGMRKDVNGKKKEKKRKEKKRREKKRKKREERKERQE